jgi:hypothetical protein
MAATEKKTGSSWFSGWFKPKALSDAIKNVTLSLEVDGQANPSITLRGEEGDIKALIKSLKYEGVDIPEGHLKRSIVFQEEENIEQLVSALEKLRGQPKKMNLPNLKIRATEAEMAVMKLETVDADLKAIRQQNDPHLSNLRAHVRLAVIDMQEKIAASAEKPKKSKKDDEVKKKKAEPEVTQADFILETQYTLDAANSPEGGVALRFPADADQKTKRTDLNELRAEFGDEGAERVKGYQKQNDPSNSGVIITGITAEELGVSGGAAVGKSEIIEKIRAIKAAVNTEMVIDLAEVPNLAEDTKSVSFRFPVDLPRERKQAYLQELRANFGEGGKDVIKGYQSKSDPSVSGITIVGLDRNDVLEAGQTKINNKLLAEKVRAMSAVEVQPIPVDVATEVIAAPSSAEQVTAFLKEFRSKMVRDSHNHEQELDKAAITFPKRSKVIRFAGIGPEAGDLRTVVAAFKAEGFNHTGIIAGNEIHIDLSGTDRSSRVAAVSGSSTPSSLEGKMETLLSTAFKAPEVTQLMAEYKRRNPPSQAAETAIG